MQVWVTQFVPYLIVHDQLMYMEAVFASDEYLRKVFNDDRLREQMTVTDCKIEYLLKVTKGKIVTRQVPAGKLKDTPLCTGNFLSHKEFLQWSPADTVHSDEQRHPRALQFVLVIEEAKLVTKLKDIEEGN